MESAIRLTKTERLRLLELHEKLTQEIEALKEAKQAGNAVYIRVRGTGPGFRLPDTAQGLARKEHELLEIESLLDRDEASEE